MNDLIEYVRSDIVEGVSCARLLTSNNKIVTNTAFRSVTNRERKREGERGGGREGEGREEREGVV